MGELSEVEKEVRRILFQSPSALKFDAAGNGKATYRGIPTRAQQESIEDMFIALDIGYKLSLDPNSNRTVLTFFRPLDEPQKDNLERLFDENEQPNAVPKGKAVAPHFPAARVLQEQAKALLSTKEWDVKTLSAGLALQNLTPGLKDVITEMTGLLANGDKRFGMESIDNMTSLIIPRRNYDQFIAPLIARGRHN